MRFRAWDKGSIERIYVDGLPGAEGKAYLYLQRGRLRVVPEVLIESEQFCIDQLAARAGLPSTSSGDALYAAIKQLALAPQPRAARGASAAHTAIANFRNGPAFGTRSQYGAAPTGVDLHAQRYLLESFNGVSAGLADALLRHFGTVRAVLMANEAELRAVKGIGPKTATRIVELLTATYSSMNAHLMVETPEGNH